MESGKAVEEETWGASTRGREVGREAKANRGTTEYKTFNVCRTFQRSHPFSPCLSPPPPATVRRPAGQHAGLPRSQDAAAPPGPQQQRAHLALLAEERQDLHQPHHSSQGRILRPAAAWASADPLTPAKPRRESGLHEWSRRCGSSGQQWAAVGAALCLQQAINLWGFNETLCRSEPPVCGRGCHGYRRSKPLVCGTHGFYFFFLLSIKKSLS